MTAHNRQIKRIPTFDSEDEEREFWATHDTTDYFDLSEATLIRSPAELDAFFDLHCPKTVSVSLPGRLINELKALAHKRNVPFDDLISRFLAERIEQETRS